MAGTRPNGHGLFSKSVQALRDLKSRFEALDQSTTELSVVFLQIREPLPDLPVLKLRKTNTPFARSAAFLLKAWTLCDPNLQRSIRPKPDAIPFTLEDRTARFVNSGLRFGRSFLPEVSRQYLIFRDIGTASKLQSVSKEAATLIRNVIEWYGIDAAIRQLFPDIPKSVSFSHDAGFWFDFVFEVGRWALPSTPLRCLGMARFEADGGIDVPIDISSNDLWTNWTQPDQPCVLQMTLEGFASKSAAVIDLLIQWGETGINPFQSRVDAHGALAQEVGTAAMSDAAGDGYDQNERLFDRAENLCRLCLRVLNRFQSFRTYVDDGLADAGKMYGANDSPKQLREILEELRVTARNQISPTVQDAWMLLPGIEVANSESLRSIRCGDIYVSTATESAFRQADALHANVSSSCLWLPGDDPKWGGRVIAVSTLQPYQDVMNRIQERLTATSLTENSFRELEDWIDKERIRTWRYWCDTNSPQPTNSETTEVRRKRKRTEAIIERLKSERQKLVQRQAGGDGAGRGKDNAAAKPPRVNKGHLKNSEELFKAALRKHHGYQTGGSVSTYVYATTRRIAELVENRISAKTAERQFNEHFGTKSEAVRGKTGGIDAYRASCVANTIGMKLTFLFGDALKAFGVLGDSQDEISVDDEQDDESNDEDNSPKKRHQKRNGVDRTF